jgi:prepilin-type N-terminal cleavage/methylation domain-containing protein
MKGADMRTANINRAGLVIPQSAIRNPQSRRAFTLVELLVAIAIIVALAAIVLVFLPKREVRLAAQGAEQLQTYIASAKSRALRDQAPRGVRFLPSPQGGFREFQYIEVPEPYQPAGQLNINAGNLSLARVGGDVTGAVAYGDMLELPLTYEIHRVSANPSYDAASNTTSVQLATPASMPVHTAFDYRFIRQPRPLLGETTLQLPNTVYVQPDSRYTGTPNSAWDFPNANQNSLNIPTSYDTGNFDIIFSASGSVINAIGGRIVLVVWDDNRVSQPTLLTVYSYTGGVASHPKGPAGQEYSYTQDGRSSGQ